MLCNGERLPDVEVKAVDLAGFNWMLNLWPAACTIEPVYAAEKNIATAIRSTSAYAEQISIFGYTGWTDLTAENVDYLLPGNKSYEVDLRGKLAHYRMADSYDAYDIREAAELLTSDFMPVDISSTLLAYTFLSPLNPFLQEAGFEPKFILSLIGQTGSMKSTVAALFSGFFGHFTATDSPTTFRDTANSILFSAGSIRHALFVIDDFHPSSQFDVTSMTNTLENIVRYFGDRTGRERMTSDLHPVPSVIPHGNAIITAESMPNIARSSYARLFCLEMKPNQIDLAKLSIMQQRSADEVFMRCMFAYIEWLKEKYVNPIDRRKRFIEELKSRYVASRSHWTALLKSKLRNYHSRLPDTLACLSVGYDFCLNFFYVMGAADEEHLKSLRERFGQMLFDLARKQTDSIEQQSASRVYISKLMSLIESGEVCFVHENTKAESYPRNLIGFYDCENYYIFLDVSHKYVSRLCREQGEDFRYSSKEVSAELASENIIVSKDGKKTFSRRFDGEHKRVMIMSKQKVEEVMKEMG